MHGTSFNLHMMKRSAPGHDVGSGTLLYALECKGSSKCTCMPKWRTPRSMQRHMSRPIQRRRAVHAKAKAATQGSAWQGKDGDVWQCMPRQRQRRRVVHGKAKTAAQGSACQAQCSGACQGKDSDAGQCMPRQRPRQRRRAFMSMPRQKHMRVAGTAPKQKRHSRCGFGSGIKCIRQNRRAAHLLRKLAEP